MKPFPKIENTLAEASQRIQNGDALCVDILRECLAKIDETEADIRAWVRIDRDGAVAQAEQLDAELAAGNSRGPLHGIPIGIKDIVDVAGYVTGAGSDYWSSQPAREADAPLVTMLRQAGAVILGKTVTTQFAGFDPSVTRNPWNLDRTPAGSSSGSGAAVAAGHCLGAIGSQTGGSITRPSAFCGIAGCKPGLDRIPIEGVVPIAKSLDHPGPMAKTVEDLALMMSVLLPTAVPAPDTVPSPPGGEGARRAGEGPAQNGIDSRFAKSSPPHPAFGHLLPPGEKGRMEPPILGRVRDFSEDRMHPAMREAMGKTLETLMAAGCLVYDLGDEIDFAELLIHHRRLMAVEGAEFHREAFAERPDDYGPRFAELVEEGLATSAVDYVASKNHQTKLSDQLHQGACKFDALVTPAAAGPAPDLTTTGDACMNSPWSYSGLPTVCFPIGLSDDGLPLAIQLAGHRNGEAELLAVAAWCEAAVRK